jgi:transcriptional regulator with XRE-family HTH domain
LEELSPETTWNSGGICIRGGRSKEGLTQKQLADLTGIAQHHISEMENGKRPIGKDTAKRLADALKLDYRLFL